MKSWDSDLSVKPKNIQHFPHYQFIVYKQRQNKLINIRYVMNYVE